MDQPLVYVVSLYNNLSPYPAKGTSCMYTHRRLWLAVAFVQSDQSLRWMLYRLSRVQCFFMGKTKTDQNYCVDDQTDWNLLCGHIPTGVLCWILAHIIMKWAAAWDFQQFDILTSVDSDEPGLQPTLKLKNSKYCSVSSLTIIEYSSD